MASGSQPRYPLQSGSLFFFFFSFSFFLHTLPLVPIPTESHGKIHNILINSTPFLSSPRISGRCLVERKIEHRYRIMTEEITGGRARSENKRRG